MRLARALLPVLLAACAGSRPEAPEEPAPAYSLREHEAAYAGPEQDAPAQLSELRIGWFGPSSADHPTAGGMWVAACLAIEEANQAGGLDGLPFRLLPVWSENPWGSGVKQVTELVFRDEICALLGSPDGPSAHLVEQVTAKTFLPFVNPVSTDKSTNLANVPWIFSCAPGDHLFAPLLARELLARAQGGDIAIVSCTDHDSRLTTKELIAALRGERAHPAVHLQFQPGAERFDNQLESLGENRPGALAVIAGPQDSARFIAALRPAAPALPVLGGPALGHGLFAATAGPAAEGALFPLLWDVSAGGEAARAFAERYEARSGAPPDYTAAHTYDATCLLLAAIRSAGPGRAHIRDALRALSPWQGVTGPITWDPTGHNARPVVLGVVRGGRAQRALPEVAPLRSSR